MDLEGLGHLSVDTTVAFEDRGKIVSSSTRFPYTTRLFVLLNLIGVPVIVFTRSATISLSLSAIVTVELHRVVTLRETCLMFI